MKQARWIAALSAWILLFCCGCTTSDQPVTGSSGNAPIAMEQPYVGIILKSSDGFYYPLIKAGAEAEADEQGVQVVIVSPDSETDSSTQADMLETMSRMSVDVIAIAPIAEKSLEDAMETADASGKIIIAIDTNLEFDGCACFVGTDGYAAAYEEGSCAAELTGSSSFAAILRGQQDDTVQDVRTQGITDALHAGDVWVLDTAVCNGSERSAEKETKALLELYQSLDIICTTSDNIAVGAQRAIAAAGRSVRLVCFGASPEVAELVLDGQLDAALAQDAYEMGQECIRAAIRLFHGDSVPRMQYTDTLLVTAENAADYITVLEQQLAAKATK